MIVASKTKNAVWIAPLGIFAGLGIATLFRGHLNAEYTFIVAFLCAAVLGMVILAIGHTRKTQRNEQLAFEQKLQMRRRTNSLGETSN